MKLALGIDLGTSGVRGAAVDETGAVVERARVPHLPQVRDRIDAALWWDAAVACLGALLQATQTQGLDAAQVASITVDGTSGSMVLTDAALNPVSRALMYNSKGFAQEAARIAAATRGAHITQGAGSALARALRLQGEAGRDARFLMHQADFVLAKLTGVPGVSDAHNCLKLGYDPETGQWPDWMVQTGLNMDLLPNVRPPGQPIALLRLDLAKRLGLRQDVMVHAGTTDSIAGFLAASQVQPGMAATSLGSTLVVKLVSETRIDAPELGLYSHKIGLYWLVGGASNTGGAVLDAHFTPDELNQLSRSIDPAQPSGLDYYPLLSPGERFPVNDPDLPPRLDPRPSSDAKFLHGLFEGMARIEAQCYAVIRAHGGPKPKMIQSVGGGAQNETWAKIRQNALGIAPKTAQETEAAVGVARLPTLMRELRT